MARHTKRLKPWWLAVAAVFLLAGIWAIQAWTTQPQNETSDGNKMTTKRLDVRPQLIDTSDAYTRYTQSLTTGDVQTVVENNIYYAKNIDWNRETVVAIAYTLLDAATVTSAGIESVDGAESYVIDVLAPPSCGAYPQVNSQHVAFIKQSGSDTNRPVIIRTTPNTAECPDVLR